ncbi:MAG: cobyrinate a,c-diamide synthase [Pseudomonadota bacterium]
MTAPGLIIAAPASGSGKTVMTLAVLRALKRRGLDVRSFKAGPDYIDPAFHTAATGRPAPNLDPWAMRDVTLQAEARRVSDDADIIVGEGVMGLFDGALDGTGSTADLAARLAWPVVLVIDVRGQATSAAATLTGFVNFRSDVRIAGVIFNRVGGDSHAELLRDAVADRVPVIGAVPRDQRLELPERHLGLVQAGEHGDLERFLETAADIITEAVDLDALVDVAARPALETGAGDNTALPPLGQRIAVARDEAFAFAYPGVLEGWRRAGADLTFFSPLADQAPDRSADAVYLPGGYPELHGARLAANGVFMHGLREAGERQAFVFGECGGFMVLGETLRDGDGRDHKMAGLLPVATSFAAPRLHLGYRRLSLLSACPLGAMGGGLRGHEFHYAAEIRRGGDPFFATKDARCIDRGEAGSRVGSVAGSFLHLIDRDSG